MKIESAVWWVLQRRLRGRRVWQAAGVSGQDARILGVTGRFKTSHLWALFKTSHDVMQLMSSVRLYGGCRPGQRASPACAFFFSFREETGMRLAGSRGGNESLVAGAEPAKSRTDAHPLGTGRH